MLSHLVTFMIMTSVPARWKGVTNGLAGPGQTIELLTLHDMFVRDLASHLPDDAGALYD